MMMMSRTVFWPFGQPWLSSRVLTCLWLCGSPTFRELDWDQSIYSLVLCELGVRKGMLNYLLVRDVFPRTLTSKRMTNSQKDKRRELRVVDLHGTTKPMWKVWQFHLQCPAKPLWLERRGHGMADVLNPCPCHGIFPRPRYVFHHFIFGECQRSVSSSESSLGTSNHLEFEFESDDVLSRIHISILIHLSPSHVHYNSRDPTSWTSKG